MKTVFKYEFEFDDYFDVGLPVNAEVLTCAKQGGKWFMWALVDTETKLMETRQFRLSGTGHDLSKGQPDQPETRIYHYITTYFEHKNGVEFLWHIFEINAPNSNIMTEEEKHNLLEALLDTPIKGLV